MTRVDLHNELDPPEYGPATTLEAFLALPDIEDAPAWEFIDGRMVRKVSPRGKHAVLELALANCLNGAAGPQGLGEAFVELRCTFAGRSIVPDIVFLSTPRVHMDDSGEVADEFFGPPDMMVEILSRGQSRGPLVAKLEHATSHGCYLGVLLDPYRRQATVYRPGKPPQVLDEDGVLDAEPVLPGFRLTLAEVFGWLKRPKREGGA